MAFVKAKMKRYAVGGLFLVLALPALYQLGLLAWAIGGRLFYPFDLEWMEGGLLTHALRYLEGQDIYVAPSVEFIPYLYTPLYPLLLAGLGKIAPLSYTLGRLISIASILGVLVLAVWAVRDAAEREQRPLALLAGLFGCGFIAATYPYVEGWYDLVRADSLLVVLLMGGLVLLRRVSRRPDRRLGGWWHGLAVLCALLLSLAFFAKQTGFLFVAAGGLALLLIDRKAAFCYGVVAALVGGGGSLLYNLASGGWFWRYAYEYFQQHHKDMGRFKQAFGHVLWRYPSLTAVIAAALVLVCARGVIRRSLTYGGRGLLYWSGLLGVALLSGALSWAHQWAHFNGYIPAFVIGSVAAGIALLVIFDHLEALLPHARPWCWLPSVVLLVCVAALSFDLVRTRWEPKRYLPRPEDRAAGERLVERIRSFEGEVFVPFHPWYAHLAGKRPHVHRMGLMDVTYMPPRPLRNKRLPTEATHVAGLREAIESKRFAAIILDNKAQLWRYPNLKRYYLRKATLGRAEAPKVYTGARTVPRTLWVPKP